MDQGGSSGSKEAAPLQKGDAEMKEEPPLEKGDDDQVATRMKRMVDDQAATRMKITVDKHNTLAIDDHISQAHSDALVSLLEKGHEVIICTWCGKDRVAKVRHHLEQMPWWGQVKFWWTRIRTGAGSRAHLCTFRGVHIMFDDAGDILQEALRKGIKVYPMVQQFKSFVALCPASTTLRKSRHTFEKGLNPA